MKTVNKKYVILDASEILEKFNIVGTVKWIDYYSSNGRIEIELEVKL